MGSHLSVQCGRYADAVRYNLAAVAADRKYLDYAVPRGRAREYPGFVAHDAHMLVYSSQMTGQYTVAISAARTVASSIPYEMVLKAADRIETYVATPVHVLVRFGKWDDILSEPFPADRELYKVTTATLHYGRAIAFAALDRVPEAEAEEQAFEEAVKRVPPTWVHIGWVTIRNLMVVARFMIKGEIAYRKGQHEQAFEELRNAAFACERLTYEVGHPPQCGKSGGGPNPPVDTLRTVGVDDAAATRVGGVVDRGGFLFGFHLVSVVSNRTHLTVASRVLPTVYVQNKKQNRFTEAEQVYRDDMRPKFNPDNVWSLTGLRTCLKHRLANKLGDAKQIKAELEEIEVKLAEMKKAVERGGEGWMIEKSCFCARAGARDERDGGGGGKECCR
ncbi:hypothetical protein HDU93_001037 [Gonapodya sp. JEL0774]|nr:hypothetical protein HDU93_001037 [Gonapodya sp. JEL0774]